ncbi:putative anaerobic ribonucleoside-triphosphate reductase activating protein [Arthrobacter sp. FB24]|uniref:4Fe-4S single cluster domain-containing protein n=1 Tax=Arthrobacter sp. (strain FB24) TaxID=290399 RepID=UPI0000E5D58C|nr:4Fe-4S single cluster domain-containing protein [Arthrobacter sp. FB24]ABK02414.1 putative anaerobic ribonucleoside-triphosphate reductase activating protein [Arthrobacter sp. FB24]
MNDGHLQVARVLHGTTAEGPGLRSAVWFQGCSIQCKGCINPHLFNPRGGTRTPIAEIVDQAVAAGVEGLTLIGGEPFDQPASGAALAKAAQERGLGVIAFSGYEYESLLGRDDVTKAFLAATDLLVDGPYEARNPETRRALVGSSNQRFIHLTKRYKAYKPEVVTNRIDVRVRPNGSIDVAGFLDADGLKDLLQTTESSRAIRGRQA